MELFTRKHYSSLSPVGIMHISLLLIALGTGPINCGYSLQGIPTWISLGIKSPFIEFQAADEVLSNISIALNTTEQNIDENGMPISASGPFIYPDDLHTFTTPQSSVPTYRSAAANRKAQRQRQRLEEATENPVVADMNSKKEVTIIEIHNDDEYTNEQHDSERKQFILPLPLKTPTEEPPPTAETSKLFRNASTDFNDLRKHLLMLQNFSRSDQSFQSKFVVFPDLQRSEKAATTPTTTTTTTRRPPSAKTTTTTRQPLFMSRINAMREFSANGRPVDETLMAPSEFNNFDKITIVPQVFLQNDQMMNDDDSLETTPRRPKSDRPERRLNQGRRKNQRNQRLSADELAAAKKAKRARVAAASTTTTRTTARTSARTTPTTTSTTTTTTTTTSTTTTTTTTPAPTTTVVVAATTLVVPNAKRKRGGNGKRQRNGGRNGGRKGGSTSTTMQPQYATSTMAETINRTADTLPIAAANKTLTSTSSLPTTSTTTAATNPATDQPKLSRNIRSHKQQQQHNINQPTGKNANELLLLGQLMSNHTPLNSYKEHIDTNPELCFGVAGLSNGQRKLCAQNTHVMPAISRGARSALQECKHQFKHRRWNCSTIEDSTVFGPTSAIGSPEMAFVHALAAAGVASFIARACRDGQLASCGCSRSVRPNHLHDDWTWGGCGDDLEYGYKFAQMFIDIREKEKKRGVRGLVTVPTNSKYEQQLLSAAAADATAAVTEPADGDGGAGGREQQQPQYSNSGPIKAEDLLELQEKITKEILSSNLQQSDMQELQAKINRELLNSKVFNLEHQQQQQGGGGGGGGGGRKNRMRPGASAKARSLMNLHNNEAGRRAVIQKSKITCKCHGVSGSCSMITCWQQLTSMREIGDFLREKYDEATQVKMNKRGRLQVKDARYKVPTALDLVYLEESPDWCRANRQLQWPGTLNRVCNKTSTGLDGCAILCCGRGYNTKKIVVKERCNCKFQWCCHVKCDTCVKVIEEYSCK